MTQCVPPRRRGPHRIGRWMTSTSLVVAGLGLLALMGCRSAAGPAAALALAAEAAPAEGPAEGVPSSRAPRIRPGLRISVRVVVKGTQELEETGRRVGPDGIISLPLIGDVKASGRTLDELRKELVRLYQEFFVTPQVLCDFVIDQGDATSSPWGHVTVVGCVTKGGPVPIPPTQDLRVSAAIRLAGGYAPSAKRRDVKVIRPLGEGKTTVFQVNMRRIGTSRNFSDDIILKPGDVIHVPESIF
jgi:polysaccharide export outer membrane protein